jgi:hypothetical protein
MEREYFPHHCDDAGFKESAEFGGEFVSLLYSTLATVGRFT